MAMTVKGECRNTGRTHFKKGVALRVGISHSEETKRKLSEAMKNRIVNGWIPPFKGRVRSEETKEKIRATLLKRNEDREKKKSDVYQNNIWRELRKLVYRRDNFLCQECGCKTSKKRKLHAHHIDYDPTNNDLLNLITLCNVCHGKINFKREHWITYYKNKLFNVLGR